VSVTPRVLGREPDMAVCRMCDRIFDVYHLVRFPRVCDICFAHWHGVCRCCGDPVASDETLDRATGLCRGCLPKTVAGKKIRAKAP
jgi:hypothetical protein